PLSSAMGSETGTSGGGFRLTGPARADKTMSDSLTDYEFLIGALSGGDGSPSARAAAGTAVRDWAAGTLRAVADGRRPLRAVIHPLGFTCLPFERAGRDGVC